MIAAIYEELAARQRDGGGRCTFLEIEDRQGAAGLDLKLAILDGDLKIGTRGSDRGTEDRQLDRRVLTLAHDPKSNLGVDGPAHLLERLVEGHALRRPAVEMRDDVTARYLRGAYR